MANVFVCASIGFLVSLPAIGARPLDQCLQELSDAAEAVQAALILENGIRNDIERHELSSASEARQELRAFLSRTTGEASQEKLLNAKVLNSALDARVKGAILFKGGIPADFDALEHHEASSHPFSIAFQLYRPSNGERRELVHEALASFGDICLSMVLSEDDHSGMEGLVESTPGNCSTLRDLLSFTETQIRAADEEITAWSGERTNAESIIRHVKELGLSFRPE